MSNGESKFCYAIVRDGKVVGVELTKACAMHWVEAEIIPLAPAKQLDELLSLINDDSYAISFQSMAQYRNALIASVRGAA